MNLQEAQDFIQSETGVFLSLSEDATGGGRMQMIDSNWIVVAQRPAVGTPIGEGDAVLSAVKLTEPNDCGPEGRQAKEVPTPGEMMARSRVPRFTVAKATPPPRHREVALP